MRGKLIWKSLKTDKVSVAQLRLTDLRKAERLIASRRAEVQRGKMTFGDALKIFLQRIQGKPSIKPRTKVYYEERALALKRSLTRTRIDGRSAKHEDGLPRLGGQIWSGQQPGSIQLYGQRHSPNV